MSTITDKSPLGLSAGILYPACSHLFRLIPALGIKHLDGLITQINNFHVDFSTRTGSFKIEIPVAGNGVGHDLHLLCHSAGEKTLVVEMLTVGGELGHSESFEGVTITRADRTLDYSISEIAHFDVSFIYERYTCTTKMKGEEKIVENK